VLSFVAVVPLAKGHHVVTEHTPRHSSVQGTQNTSTAVKAKVDKERRI
jgi:hypothetical protein